MPLSMETSLSTRYSLESELILASAAELLRMIWQCSRCRSVMYVGPFIIACKLSRYRLLSAECKVKNLAATNTGVHEGKVPFLCEGKRTNGKRKLHGQEKKT